MGICLSHPHASVAFQDELVIPADSGNWTYVRSAKAAADTNSEWKEVSGGKIKVEGLQHQVMSQKSSAEIVAAHFTRTFGPYLPLLKTIQ